MRPALVIAGLCGIGLGLLLAFTIFGVIAAAVGIACLVGSLLTSERTARPGESG